MGTFRYMEGVWETRAKKMESEKPGHSAYAAREADRWKRWVRIASAEFTKVTGMKCFKM